MANKTILKTLHTKQLLKLFEGGRAIKSSIDKSFDSFTGILLNENDTSEKDIQISMKCLGINYVNIKHDITLADVREELALREHVPNKKESKQLRKEKQFRNKNKGKRDK